MILDHISSHFISGFGAGNTIKDICSHIGIVQVVINYLLFYWYIHILLFEMPLNKILIQYVIPCMTNKSVMTFLYVNKISVCLILTPVDISCTTLQKPPQTGYG